MLAELKFVRGAVSTKDFVPALMHFKIQNGRVSGYNGKMSLSCPIELDLDCFPQALPFMKAIEACAETVHLHITPGGKLAVRSGKFKAHIDTLATVYPEILPEGHMLPLAGKMLPALKLLHDYMADDASRPWATGILLDTSGSAFATNNVILIEHWLGYAFPVRMNLPRFAVKELVRIGEEPLAVQVSDKSATFHFSGERWLQTQLNAMPWPDVSGLFGAMTMHEELPPEGLFEALATLAPFVGEQGAVYFDGASVRTSPHDDGAEVLVPGIPERGAFNLKMLSSLQAVAKKLALSDYPAPVRFYGDVTRGLIMGMRG